MQIYPRLLPAIRRKIFVHVHDVFLPFGMPKEWLLTRQIFWTEQYLLLDFLLDNLKVSVLYGNHYNAKMLASLMAQLMGASIQIGGDGFWFTYNGHLHGGVNL